MRSWHSTSAASLMSWAKASLTWSSCPKAWRSRSPADRKSTRLNSSHTVIYTLSLHDALPILDEVLAFHVGGQFDVVGEGFVDVEFVPEGLAESFPGRSEEHTSELQSHRDLHSFPTRRSSDLR